MWHYYYLCTVKGIFQSACNSSMLTITAVWFLVRTNLCLMFGPNASVSLTQLPKNTSSSAVAKRPRDASCLSVVSFNSTKRQAQSSVISYTLALDLPLHKLNCSILVSSAYSLVRGFLCRKQTCTVTVIHHWTDNRQLIALAPAVSDR